MPQQKIHGYCPLCISRCGCISTVEDGVLTRVEADPAHPTGKGFCIKGKAAPELVNNPHRLLTPLRRTQPKGAPDPGWQAISWDEALDFTAGRMRETAERHGAEAVGFSVTTPSGTAIGDAMPWIFRLINNFGSPNTVWTTHVCNWHKDYATALTFGADSGMPDFQRTGCLVLWGFNPSNCWLAQAGEVTAARRRGMKLVVIEPRRAGLANKADAWLRARPGTDGALALSIAGVMIENSWYDSEFIRRWSNGGFLVRDDNGHFITEVDLRPHGDPASCVQWDEITGQAAICHGVATQGAASPGRPALFGHFELSTPAGRLACRPAFDKYAALCRQYPPDLAEHLTGVPAAQIRTVAEMLYRHGPASWYAWSGVGQNTNATQTARAMCLLYALTGNIDAPGGNVFFDKIPLNDVTARDTIAPSQRARTLGLAERPLGPAKDGWITTRELYRAILDGQPYAVRGLVAFGSNLLLSRPSPQEGTRALRSLDFYVHCDLFLNAMAAEADVVLPVASPWEREGLAAGFLVSQEAEALLQLRPATVSPRGESRSDTWIVFELARRLGLAAEFFNGDMDAGLRHQVQPSGITLNTLRANPQGVTLPLTTQYRKYTDRGFRTTSGLVEIYSQALLQIGQSPLPEYVPPTSMTDPSAQPGTEFPLCLTSAKWVQYCHSQFRELPSLRSRMPDPLIELHPQTAAERRIAERDWVVVQSPHGRIRARAVFNASLAPDVVCAQFGWDAGSAETADGKNISLNFSELISNVLHDPVSGSFPLRSCACDIEKAAVP